MFPGGRGFAPRDDFLDAGDLHPLRHFLATQHIHIFDGIERAPISRPSAGRLVKASASFMSLFVWPSFKVVRPGLNSTNCSSSPPPTSAPSNEKGDVATLRMMF